MGGTEQITIPFILLSTLNNINKDEDKTIKEYRNESKKKTKELLKNAREVYCSSERILCQVVGVFVCPQSVDIANIKRTDAEKEQAGGELYYNGSR